MLLSAIPGTSESIKRGFMKSTSFHSSAHTFINERGFTLVELMVTVAIAGIVTAVLGTTYVMQQRSATAQEQVVEMQQNIRAGLAMLERDIRMAGFDPTHAVTGPKDFIVATNNTVRITQDLNQDGDVDDAGEDVTYSLYVASDGIRKLGRNDNTGGSGNQAVAENIDALEFYYTMDDGTQTTAPVSLSAIRSVQVSLLARAGRPDQDFTNTMTYTPASGIPWDLNGAAAGTANPPNDNIRRRLLITTIQCRNMGL